MTRSNRHDSADAPADVRTIPFPSRPGRYTDLPLPAYRFMPGSDQPHPTSPEGHLKDGPDLHQAALPPMQWSSQLAYLYGADLFNLAFWWECHEAWEVLWKASDEPIQRSFVQGLIQVSGALLKWQLGRPKGVKTLSSKARKRLVGVCEAGVLSNGRYYMGLDLPGYLDLLDRAFEPFDRFDREADDPAPDPALEVVLRLGGLAG
jgi:hypothetical protein